MNIERDLRVVIDDLEEAKENLESENEYLKQELYATNDEDFDLRVSIEEKILSNKDKINDYAEKIYELSDILNSLF